MSLDASKIFEIEEVDYSPAISSSYLQILSFYNYSGAMKGSDLLSTYLSFHWSYYFAIIATFIIFTISWSYCSLLSSKISRKLLDEIVNSRKPPWWIMICAILDQDQYPVVSRISFTILSLCSSSFFYLLIDCFILSMISTDLVVIDEPRVINDYVDTIKADDDGKGVRVWMWKGSTEEEFFKDSLDGTLEREVWNRRIRTEETDVTKLLGPLMEQRYIMICRNGLITSLANYFLQMVYMTDDYGRNLRAVIVNDLTDKSWTNALIINTGRGESSRLFLIPSLCGHFSKSKLYPFNLIKMQSKD